MKIERTFIRITNWILSGLLILLGFSSCDAPMEYGTPNADYTLKGKVVDKADAKAIKGIRVGFNRYPGPMVMYGVAPSPYFRLLAADTTNAEGEYKFTEKFYIDEVSTDSVQVFVQDIDGTENGSYRDTVLYVDFEDAEQSGKAKNWYSGELTVEKTIELNKKTEGDE